jgi:hypothetical protein
MFEVCVSGVLSRVPAAKASVDERHAAREQADTGRLACDALSASLIFSIFLRTVVLLIRYDDYFVQYVQEEDILLDVR